MKTGIKYFLLMIALIALNKLSAQSTAPFFDSLGIVPKGGEPLIRLNSVFKFTEGPVADKWGRVYFTDQPNNKIWRYNLDGSLTEFKNKAGRANGLDIDAKGNIIACADEHNELWSIDTSGNVKVIMGKVNGKQLNGPNDLWIDKKEGIYFTDPYYQRDYWTRQEPEIKEQAVYYLPKGAAQPIIVSNELVKPNGIVGTKDGKFLFVADIADNKIYRFSIEKDGGLTNKKLFVNQGSDGITLDNKGNLYLTGNGVTVYNPAGIKIAYIPVPEKWTANICFGGKNRDLLFITAGTRVYLLRMNVKGQ